MEKKKPSKLAVVQTILIAAILAVVLTVGVMMISTLSTVNSCVQTIEEDLQAIDPDQLKQTVDSLEDAADNLGKLDMKSLNGILDSINETAQTLKDVSSVIGGLFGK